MASLVLIEHPTKREARLIESLEQRQHLSATLTNGILHIAGTTGDDAIRISMPSGITINALNSRILTVRINNLPDQQFSLSDVHAIQVDGLLGNDDIEVVGTTKIG